MKNSIFKTVGVALATLTCFLAVSPAAHAGVQTETPKPLSEQSMPTTGNYNTDNVQRMPVIAWGADLATIHANGGATTASGSYMDRAGLDIKLYRQDDFAQQVRDFKSGKTNYLRGTAGMIFAASDVLCDDNRTCPEVIYNMSRSAGGDALVVRGGINNISDLRGKTIGLQLYGPHQRLLTEVLALGNLKPSDVNVKWYRDLDVNGQRSASHAFEAGEVDAAFVIIPDALLFTEGDAAIRGAKTVFSTKSLDYIIYDLIAVRPDYAKAQPEKIAAVTSALLKANEDLRSVISNKNSSGYDKIVRDGADLLLGAGNDPEMQAIVADMYMFDAKMQGWTGNVRFLTGESDGKRESISLQSIAGPTGQTFAQLNLVENASAPKQVTVYNHNWKALQSGLSEKFGVTAPTLNKTVVTRVIQNRSKSGTLDNDKIVEFPIFFGANQTEFSANQYASDFDRVMELASRGSGIAIVMEGHSDPVEYLRKKHKDGVAPSQYKQIQQAAKNLSRERAESVKQAILDYAKSQGVRISFEDAVIIGHGVAKPVNGTCQWDYNGRSVSDPCKPENQTMFEQNRRVEFSLVVVEAESDVFIDDF